MMAKTENELVAMKNGKMTVTSLELAEQVNFFREKLEGKAKLEHKDLLKIIRDEFAEEISLGEISLVNYKDKKSERRPIFELTTLQAKQLLARDFMLRT